jgi:hypothetical protein
MAAPMTSKRPDRLTIARSLRDVATPLALAGEEPFRARAYERAAATLERLDLDLQTLVDDGRLTELPGIGRGLAAVIEELYRTGRSKVLDALRQRVPPGALELNRIPGLGLAKISALHSALGIETIADLRAACEEGRVRRLRRRPLRRRSGEPALRRGDGPPRLGASRRRPQYGRRAGLRARGVAGRSRVRRVFLLSPAHCRGERARLLVNPHARFDLARRLHDGPAPTLGEVFTFMSGLYFRGKIAYARAFAAPPPRVPGVWVITPCDGLCGAEEAVDIERLRRFAETDIGAGDARYADPLLRDSRLLARALDPSDEVVLLGSVATGKYVDPLLGVFGARLRFPSAFVGRGDMSRGGLLLRSAAAGLELAYVPVSGAVRHGARPPRLGPRR